MNALALNDVYVVTSHRVGVVLAASSCAPRSLLEECPMGTLEMGFRREYDLVFVTRFQYFGITE